MTTTALSKRLSEAKDALGVSNRWIVNEALKGGYEISTYTVTQCLNGKHGKVTRPTVAALAYALRIPEAELTGLAGIPEELDHFRLEGRVADYAKSLTRPQAEAVQEIMRLLAEGNEKEVVEDEDDSAPMNRADLQYTDHAAEYGQAAHPEQHEIAHDELPSEDP